MRKVAQATPKRAAPHPKKSDDARPVVWTGGVYCKNWCEPGYPGEGNLKRRTAFAAIAAATGLAAVFGLGIFGSIINSSTLSLIVTYAVLLVLGRYSPGKCMHRMIVLGNPDRHVPLEVERARAFASFVAARLLFAGLIFTLADIARVLSQWGDLETLAQGLALSLVAALYAMVFYVAVGRLRAAAVAVRR